MAGASEEGASLLRRVQRSRHRSLQKLGEVTEDDSKLTSTNHLQRNVFARLSIYVVATNVILTQKKSFFHADLLQKKHLMVCTSEHLISEIRAIGVAN